MAKAYGTTAGARPGRPRGMRWSGAIMAFCENRCQLPVYLPVAFPDDV
jgi:hypothetical protein